jgi:malonate transporter
MTLSIDQPNGPADAVDTFFLLLPELALIATGVALTRVLPLGPGAWAAIEKLIYMVLFPPLIFLSIARQPLGQLQAGSFAVGVFLVLLLGIVLGGVGGWVTGTRAPRFASGVQCAFRFNGYLAIALSQRLGGEAGLALCGVMVAIAVPMGNLAAVAFLARGAGQSVVREVTRNPLVIGAVAGLVASALQWSPPEPLQAYLSRLGSASIGLGLIAVGAGLRLSDARGNTGFASWVVAVKLGAMPASVLLIAPWLGLSSLATQILMVFAVVPTASSAYILATRMGGDGPYTARLITTTTVGAAVAIPLWIGVVRPALP